MRRTFTHIAILTALAVVCFVPPNAGAENLGFLQLVEQDVQRLADGVRPSVVTIHAISRQPATAGHSGSTMGSNVVSTFVGSGIVLDTTGHILTTALVVEGSDQFLVVLPDSRVFEATLVGKNSAADVAVLRIPVRGLIPPVWDDSDSLRPGSIIVTMGNSYGCGQAVSWGTVSGFRPDGSTIQMNVSVSAGNSGGAVINSAGKVSGMIKAKVSEASRVPPMRVRSSRDPKNSWHLPGFKIELPTAGVALAVPINMALTVAERLVRGEGDEYAYLGVYVSDVYSWLAQFYHTDKGVVVGGVVEQTPAAKYGLQKGDLIRGFDNVKVQNVRHFRELIANTRPGDRVMFDILRGGTSALKVNLVMGRAGTPRYMERGWSDDVVAKSDLVRESAEPQMIHPDDSMSIERLNKIRRRILEGGDSLQTIPVDVRPNH